MTKNLVTWSILVDTPITDMDIYQRSKLQVQPNTKDNLKD